MRNPVPAIAFATLLSGAAATFAGAAPADPSLMGPRSDIVPVRLVCDPSRCIDPATGAYTASACNGRRCFPTSGVIGYAGGGYGGYGYGGYGTGYGNGYFAGSPGGPPGGYGGYRDPYNGSWHPEPSNQGK